MVWLLVSTDTPELIQQRVYHDWQTQQSRLYWLLSNVQEA